MGTLVVIPTYNEVENIGGITDEILSLYKDIEILVVDDSSPDGTGQLVSEKMNSEDRLHLLSRKEKEGLGKAYLAGFKWGIENGFDSFVEMDADFSHRPVDLEKILEAGRNNDFVIGSRYVEGGGVRNWGWIRQFISRGGSFYTRCILGYPLRDWTGGFNLWSKAVLEDMGLENIKSEGYSFQIELKYRAMKLGHTGIEVPIVFEDRRVGQSKMSSRIFLEALYRVWQIRH